MEQEINRYYDDNHEAARLSAGPGLLELERTRDIITRYLPEPPARILDVGGAAGVHALWLLEQGYDVTLIDPVERHVQQAAAAFQQAGHARAAARVGDARELDVPDASIDAVLMLGPLYHLTERTDRIAALREAVRVLAPGGMLFAAVISRYASLLDGYTRGNMTDAAFARIVERDLTDGQHRNDTARPDYFTTAYFHRPDEITAEAADAGLAAVATLAIEGPFWMLPEFSAIWGDDARRGQLLSLLRRVEAEPALLGASAHIMLVARVA